MAAVYYVWKPCLVDIPLSPNLNRRLYRWAEQSTLSQPEVAAEFLTRMDLDNLVLVTRKSPSAGPGSQSNDAGAGTTPSDRGLPLRRQEQKLPRKPRRTMTIKCQPAGNLFPYLKSKWNYKGELRMLPPRWLTGDPVSASEFLKRMAPLHVEKDRRRRWTGHCRNHPMTLRTSASVDAGETATTGQLKTRGISGSSRRHCLAKWWRSGTFIAVCTQPGTGLASKMLFYESAREREADWHHVFL